MLPERFRSQEVTIHPENSKSLQEMVDAALRDGISRIILEGVFEPHTDHQFTLLRVSHNLEIIGKNQAVIDGLSKVSHLVFVEDGISLKVSGVTFRGGNTIDQKSQLSSLNHPKMRLNIFRYLDGGAITMGLGSTVELMDCVFRDNVSAVCGGALSNLGGYLNVSNCKFENNTCGDTGAAIDNLASGSLTVVRDSTFVANLANQLGGGNYGAITAFPDTYLIVTTCDFAGETATAIDYIDNSGQQSHHFIQNCTFNPDNPHAVVVNPVSNAGTRKAILSRYFQLLKKKPLSVKFEGIPKVDKAVRSKHQEMYEAELDQRSDFVPTSHKIRSKHIRKV